MTPVRALDSQMRQLRDLAQRTSREVRIGTRSIGLAFTRTVGDATILVELLTVPNDVYRIVRLRNVVLMYKPVARPAFAAASACLRR